MQKSNPRAFHYKGLRFTALRNFTAEEKSNFTQHISIHPSTPQGWDYAEFYRKAKTHNAYVDIFTLHGQSVIPSKNVIFIYHP